MTSDDLAAQNAELQADNARLRRLLDRQNAPAELRHQLRGLVGLLRSVIRHSARSRSMEDYAAHLEDRLDALTRVQGTIDLRGEVDLHALIADEMVSHAAREGDRFSLSGPEVTLQPRAAQVLGLAIHELAVNAVEHGGMTGRDGRIDVAWRVEPGDPDPSLVFLWRETGTLDPEHTRRSGFGTEVLTSTVRYSLAAVPSLSVEDGGLRYELTLPLSPRIGRSVGSR